MSCTQTPGLMFGTFEPFRMGFNELWEGKTHPATPELTVFTGFHKGGISKSLLEAIGRIQVVRGIPKPMLLAG